jgi:hypothetical protein
MARTLMLVKFVLSALYACHPRHDRGLVEKFSEAGDRMPPSPTGATALPRHCHYHHWGHLRRAVTVEVRITHR